MYFPVGKMKVNGLQFATLSLELHYVASQLAVAIVVTVAIVYSPQFVQNNSVSACFLESIVTTYTCTCTYNESSEIFTLRHSLYAMGKFELLPSKYGDNCRKNIFMIQNKNNNVNMKEDSKN